MDDRTAAVLKSIVTTAFVGTWIGLAVVSVLMNRRMDAASKKRWMPRGAILAGALFVFFVTTLSVIESRSWSYLSVLFLVVPVVVLITYLNRRFTKVCDKCGAVQYSHNWFTPMRFCSKCGAEFDPSESAGGDHLKSESRSRPRGSLNCSVAE